VSSVTNMVKMFKQAKKFNQDLQSWQVGQMETKKKQCKDFCRLSVLSGNNAPGLPNKCLKGCRCGVPDEVCQDHQDQPNFNDLHRHAWVSFQTPT
jgi:hypothetical protein